MLRCFPERIASSETDDKEIESALAYDAMVSEEAPVKRCRLSYDDSVCVKEEGDTLRRGFRVSVVIANKMVD